MRLLFVVQRYGQQVAGGAETFCRHFATRLARRGHDVEVVTSCATSYVDWADVFAPGSHEDEGVLVHRLPVVRPRDDGRFGALNARIMNAPGPIPLYFQQQWMEQQGPRLTGFEGWLQDRAAGYDAVVFFTYLYHTTWAGLRAVAAGTPTILHPAAHDEAPLYLPLFDLLFRLPDGIGYLTPEEEQLVKRRFRVKQDSVVTGIGTDLDVTGDGDRFRQRFGIGGDPFVLCTGRIDPHKGALELNEFFRAYKARNPGPLRLVYVGESVRPLDEHPDVLITGFVDEQTKHDGFDAADVFVQPSYFESFSMVLTEAWVHRKPALVQGHCDVLAGQARRSGGGLAYTGFAEFEAALTLLSEDQSLARRLGSAGRRYVEVTYEWEGVLSTYEQFLGRIIDGRGVNASGGRP